MAVVWVSCTLLSWRTVHAVSVNIQLHLQAAGTVDLRAAVCEQSR